MVRLLVGNATTSVDGYLEPVVYKALRNNLGYRPEDAIFRQRNSHHWDGIISTICYKGKCKCPIPKPLTHFPTGLLGKAWEIFDQYHVPYENIDERDAVPTTNLYSLDESRILRDYQQVIVDRAAKLGRGIVKLATGGGKTSVAAALIAKLGVTPFIFYVPSQDLLRQAYEELTLMIRKQGSKIRIGRVGGGHRDIQPITVMTVQTAVRSLDPEKNKIAEEQAARAIERKQLLEEKKQRKIERERLRLEKEEEKAKMRAKRAMAGLKPLKKYEPTVYKRTKKEMEEDEIPPVEERDDDDMIDGTEEYEDLGEYRQAVKELIMASKGMICDEVQHWASETCQLIADWSINCRYRYGFSATPWRDMGDDLLIDACFGKVIGDINASHLIESKFLVPPTIYFVPVRNMKDAVFVNYHEAYELGIAHNQLRNQWIASIAQNLVNAGRQLLILVKHISHGDILAEMIPGSVFLSGINTSEQRKLHIEAMRKREVKVTIASTIFDEGIDVKPLDGLILAGSGKSQTRALQRIGRVIRPFSNDLYVKKDAVVIDFNDDMKWMKKHSAARKKIYRTEPLFTLKELVLQ